MTVQCDWIVGGAAETGKRIEGDARVVDVRSPLFQMAPGDWDKQLAGVQSDVVVLAENPQPVTQEESAKAIEQLMSNAELGFVLLVPPADGDSVSPYAQLPTSLALLADPPVRGVCGIIGRASELKAFGFTDESNPLWDLLIRASLKPKAVTTQALADPSGSNVSRAEKALPDLAPQQPDPNKNWLKSHIDIFDPGSLGEIQSQADAVALKSGLLQIHDYLHESHELSQSVQGRGRNAAGDYWHAIMHRREPDYSNSKYWYRSVGSHPVFERLSRFAESLLSSANNAAADAARQKLLKGKWDPFTFVDFCQECERSGDAEATKIAQQIQWAEMQLLLQQTYRDAVA